ncbi:magnesium transporter MRS2-2-like isoform X3 [Salvia splendens]|uniref:magnesium transporter MRS2-2-like isoform X3 n=1 Tax=Salvia splendens TaxID=180675 RepID=UPI001C27842B|nr:magnesium transporter MRS2-2-like isoform X3 [Salvia splendens]
MMEQSSDELGAAIEMSFKKKAAVPRNWMVVDSCGEGMIVDWDKFDIMRRLPINARDLRILDPLLSYPSAILVRDTAIVLNLEVLFLFLFLSLFSIYSPLLNFIVLQHIKAIITTDEVLLRDPLDENVAPIVEELQRRLPLGIGRGEGEEEELLEARSGEVDSNELVTDFPFEFRALEVALEGVCSSLDAQTRELEISAYPALDELTAKTNSTNLDRVRKIKSSMTRLTSRVQKVRDELEQLLDDDDDMADLYLSRKMAMSASVSTESLKTESRFYTSRSRSSSSKGSAVTTTQEENNVDELEMLLEAYFMQIESTMNKLTTLREYIDDTEDYINIQEFLRIFYPSRSYYALDNLIVFDAVG